MRRCSGEERKHTVRETVQPIDNAAVDLSLISGCLWPAAENVQYMYTIAGLSQCCPAMVAFPSSASAILSHCVCMMHL